MAVQRCLLTMARYRAACENVIFADFEHASAHAVEQQLWNAHVKVNGVFRKENRSVGRIRHRNMADC